MHIHCVIPFRFWMPEWRMCSLLFLHKIGCHGNVPWDIRKSGPDRSLAFEAISYGEKIAKIGPVNPEIFDEIRRTTTWKCNATSIRMFYAKTTGPNFTKILHDIVALVSHSVSECQSDEWRWSILTLPKCSKLIGYHSNVPWATTKLM